MRIHSIQYLQTSCLHCKTVLSQSLLPPTEIILTYIELFTVILSENMYYDIFVDHDWNLT